MYSSRLVAGVRWYTTRVKSGDFFAVDHTVEFCGLGGVYSLVICKVNSCHRQELEGSGWDNCSSEDAQGSDLF